MSDPYGMPRGTAINYNQLGFPWWVDELCRRWNLDSSTYPGHQESDRPDIGAAPNPAHLNRGIDWAGDPQKMLEFAHWLKSIGPPRTPGRYGPAGLEMVIYQDPRTGERVGYPDFVNYGADYGDHTDHVHIRTSASLLDEAPLSKADQYALAIIAEGRKRNISPKGIQIALCVPFVESGYRMYANSNVPESLNFPHDAVGFDHDSTGLFQQRQAWGPLSCTMNAACSAGLFYDGGHGGQRGLRAFPYDSDQRTPGGWAQAVQVSAYPDRYDQRFGDAVNLYNRLAGVAAPDEEDWMANPELERMIRELHAAMFNRTPSESPFRHLGEGNEWELHQLIHHIDLFGHSMWVEWAARAGNPDAISLLYEVANADPQRYPDRQGDAAMARKVLDSLVATPAAVVTATPTPQQLEPQPQPPALLPAVQNEPTTGDIIGQVYDALEQLRLADALPIEQRAPLAALIAVLNTKNGSQLQP